MELQPCPFCGGTAYFGEITHSDDVGGQFIECGTPGCRATTQLMFPAKCDVRPLLAEAWNLRSLATPPNAGRARELQQFGAYLAGRAATFRLNQGTYERQADNDAAAIRAHELELCVTEINKRLAARDVLSAQSVQQDMRDEIIEECVHRLDEYERDLRGGITVARTSAVVELLKRDIATIQCCSALLRALKSNQPRAAQSGDPDMRNCSEEPDPDQPKEHGRPRGPKR